MKKTILFLLLIMTIHFGFSQEKKEISVESIYNGTFNQQRVRGINWMNDGRYYSSQVSRDGFDLVLKYDITTGNVVDTLIDGRVLGVDNAGNPIRFGSYQLNRDESKALIETERESIYRRSYKANHYIYDIAGKDAKPLFTEEKQGYATFSPDGNRVAFTVGNNLHMAEISGMDLTAITSTGKFNELIHGSCDWVYEEEFSFIKAFFWSPDSRKIAFYTFNEKDVNLYNMQKWGEIYPQDYKFKYPKAGERNSEVTISIYNIDNGKTLTMDTGEEKDIYIPKVQWTQDSDLLSVTRLNRLQNHMELIHFDVNSGSGSVVIEEKSETYVDTEYNDVLIYLNDGNSFLRTSEENGFKHIYLHELGGKMIRQITDGNWEVRELLGVDQKTKSIYYMSAEDSPIESHLYSIGLNGKGKKKLTSEAGTNEIDFSPDFRYYIKSFNSINQPLIYTVHDRKGTQLRIIEENAALTVAYAGYNTGIKELISVEVNDTQLNGYLIKPDDFDPNKSYPMLMFLYGGPGSQRVFNRWNNSRDYWHRMLASKGYLVACIDNRGTGGRGREFKHITYGQLGKYEVEDQLAVARYFADQSYVDSERLGIWGWSYGGYMSSLALFLGPDLFKMGIAVAPVSNWKYYDTIYTERYLKRPQDNEEGYEAFSPINHAHKLDSKYLLIHGTGDDNVHVQNSIELVDMLVRHNKQFDSFYYPNRNHGIYGGNTRIHLFNMLTQYILENL